MYKEDLKSYLRKDYTSFIYKYIDMLQEIFTYLKYSSNPKDMSDYGETAHHKKYVYSSKIEVTKINGDSNEKLADATFVLMKGNQYYNVDANGNVTWVDDLNNQDPTLCATKYTTQADGIITFAGIMDGDYKLVEVEAPAGYNKLPLPVDVSVNGTTINQQTGVPTSNATTKIIANSIKLCPFIFIIIPLLI